MKTMQYRPRVAMAVRSTEKHTKHVFLAQLTGNDPMRQIPIPDDSGDKKGCSGNHASIVAIYRKGKAGLVEILAMQVEQILPHRSLRMALPAETQEFSNETPHQTANSCIETEIAKAWGNLPFAFKVEETPIYSEEFPSDGGFARTATKKEMLGVPEWYPIDELFDVLCQRGKVFHRKALLKVLEALCSDKQVFERYGGALSTWPGRL